jgi:hypothetical protein
MKWNSYSMNVIFTYYPIDFNFLFLSLYFIWHFFLGQKKVTIDENLLAKHLNYNVMKTEMEKAVVSLKNSYIKNLSLRSSTGKTYASFFFFFNLPHFYVSMYFT